MLVVVGNVVDSNAYTTASTTVQNLSVRLLMLASVKNRLGVMAGDIGNVFLTATYTEKVWSITEAEFSDALRRMGIVPTRADQDLWYNKSDEYKGCDYLAIHVDDLLIAARNPSKYMSEIKQ
eukprot:2907230-Ditylum_brightwellii.AAC.1